MSASRRSRPSPMPTPGSPPWCAAPGHRPVGAARAAAADQPAGVAWVRASAWSAAAAAASSAASASSSVCWNGVAGDAAAGSADPSALAAAALAAAALRGRPPARGEAASGRRAPSASAPSGAASVGRRRRPHRRRPLPRAGGARGGRIRSPAPGAGRGASSDDSYSATLAKTGSPADAARARVAGSTAITDSRFSWVIASRASRRKLIRDVATRDPCGSTTATRRPAADRTRAAAEVISSSMSR